MNISIATENNGRMIAQAGRLRDEEEGKEDGGTS